MFIHLLAKQLDPILADVKTLTFMLLPYLGGIFFLKWALLFISPLLKLVIPLVKPIMHSHVGINLWVDSSGVTMWALGLRGEKHGDTWILFPPNFLTRWKKCPFFAFLLKIATKFALDYNCKATITIELLQIHSAVDLSSRADAPLSRHAGVPVVPLLGLMLLSGGYVSVGLSWIATLENFLNEGHGRSAS